MPSSSMCWKFMTLKSDKKIVVCNVCTAQLTYSTSTTNLIRHLKSKHPFEVEQFEASKKRKAETHERTASQDTGIVKTASGTVQPTLSQTIERSTKYKPDSIRKQEIDRLIVRMITSDLELLSVVEKRKGFRGLISYLDPRYELVSRKRMSTQLLPAHYERERAILADELATVSHLSLTTDCWTSRANDGYMTITVHYINSQWDLKARVLSTKSDKKRHTAENLSSDLMNAIQEWGIDQKVTTIVSDNARNIKNAIDMCNKRHHPCFAHTLNLVVKESIKESDDINSLKMKVKEIVTFFHSSTVANNSLKDVHSSKGTPIKKLKQDVDTRWNSTYEMLRSSEEQHDQVTTVPCLSGKNNMCLDSSDLDCLRRSALVTLEPFYEAMVERSCEKNTSLSKIIPIVYSLMRFTAKDQTPLSAKLNSNMNRRFAGVEDKTNLKLSTILDLRFKKVVFPSTSSADSAVDKLRDVARGIRLSNNDEITTVESENAEDAPGPSKKPSMLWGELDKKLETPRQSRVPQLTAAEMEVRRFLEMPQSPRQCNPLKWWKENSSSFPRLELIAKDVLSTPATSVPSERLFSKARELISNRRSNLSHKNVDMILFLNNVDS